VLGIALKPYAGLTTQLLHQGAFSETTDFGLDFPSQSFTKVTTLIGARAQFSFQFAGFTVVPQGNLAWSHALHDGSLFTHAALYDSPFLIEAADRGSTSTSNWK